MREAKAVKGDWGYLVIGNKTTEAIGERIRIDRLTIFPRENQVAWVASKSELQPLLRSVR